MTVPAVTPAPTSAPADGGPPVEAPVEFTRTLRPDVAVVGGGPSGLRAATELAGRLRGGVLVLERETVAGGIPRHSDHPGYGIRDLRRFTSGPKYAAILRRRADEAGATVLTQAMVTGWAGDTALAVTTPGGRLRVEARAVVLATGARERPRAARMIPGDRARGVYTTGHLQNVVHLKHGRVGKRAVVIGSELVSWSAVLTLRHVGCATVLMTTEYPRADAYAVFTIPGRHLFDTTTSTRTRLVRILGRPDVTGVELEHLDTGARRIVACDTVVLTGDWIPDNELARAAGIELDPHTRGPVVDAAMRTSAPGVFAVGNALHPVDTADVAALDGAAVADHVVDHLAGVRPSARQVRLGPGPGLRWVTPAVLRADDPAPARHRLLCWTDTFVAFPRVTLSQDGHVVASRRLAWPAAPGRVFRVPSGLLGAVDWTGGPLTLDVGR